MKAHRRIHLPLALAALLAACSDSGPAPAGPSDLAAAADQAPAAADQAPAAADLTPAAADLTPAAADLAPISRPLDEEFDGTPVLGRLLDLYPQLHDPLPLAGAAPGRLALTPVAVANTHWYSDNEGPLLYRAVTGNFVVEIDVNIGRRDDMTQAPRGSFNAGGLLVRDPASARRSQRWLMYNLGHQVGAVAREAKTTRPGAAESLSTLYLIRSPGGARAAKLRICRLGDTFYLLHRHPGEASWVEEAHDATTAAMGNGAAEQVAGVVPGGVIRFVRPDLPATLQVGVMVGAWEPPLEARAEFDYLRFGAAAAPSDCTAPLR